MKQRYTYLLLTIILLFGAFLRVFYWSGMPGTDFPYHYTVVEHMAATDTYSPFNPMAHCGEGAIVHHPAGFYLFPYLFAQIMGVHAAFFVIPVVFGLISIILSYVLLSLMYNKKIGLLVAFFLSISLANITKSHPMIYRGETIVYPFILLSLIFMYKFLTQDRRRFLYASLSGISSALPVFLWNGYIFGIVIYFAVLTSVLVYRFFRKGNLVRDVRCSFVSILLQAAILVFAYVFTPLYGKGKVFILYYYPFVILGLFVFFASLLFSRRVRSLYPLAIAVVLLGVSALLAKAYIKTLAVGFGSITSEINFAPELASLSTMTVFYIYGGFYFLLFAALAWAIIKMDDKTVFLLAYLVPSLYTVVYANRFLYISSFPMIILCCAFLNNQKVFKRRFDLFVFLTVVLVIVQTAFIFYAAPKYFVPLNKEFMGAMGAIREKTSERACIASIDRTAFVEYFAKRFNYYNLLAFDDDRERDLYKFALYGIPLNITNDELYIFVPDHILNNIANLADVSGIPNPDVSYRLVLGNPFVFYSDQFFTVFEIDNMTVGRVYRDQYVPLRYVFMVGKGLHHDPKGSGCLYSNGLNNFDIYLGDALCDTPLYKMLTGQQIDGLELVFLEDGYAFYRYLNYTGKPFNKNPKSIFGSALVKLPAPS